MLFIDCIEELRNNKTLINYEMTHIRIIHLILIDMIQLREFSSMNCLNKHASKRNSQFFSFWIHSDHVDTHRDINKMIKIIRRTMNLKSIQSKEEKTCLFSNNRLKGIIDFFFTQILLYT